MKGSANIVPVGDYLLIQHDNTLLARRFDVNSPHVLGEPFVIAAGVLYDVAVWRGAFSVSEQGELAFHTGTSAGEFNPTRRDRSGKELGTIGDPVNLWSIRLSPDGKQLAVAVAGRESDIWLYNVARGTRTRLTFGGPGSRIDPVWSADGDWVIYATLGLADPRAGPNRICRRPAIGGDEEVLYTTQEEAWVLDASKDGKYLLLGQGKYIGESPCDIWVLPLDGEKKAFPLIQTSFLDAHAVFSPDGRWIAYDSNETGVREVYIIPFRPAAAGVTTAPEAIRGGRWRVSTHGGQWPRWSRSGKELFYISSQADSKVTVTEIITTASGIEFGKTTPLFSITQTAGVVPYDVSADGNWFVDAAGVSRSSAPINLILNWDAELTKP
jgi:Tol biopolymer transport system component